MATSPIFGKLIPSMQEYGPPVPSNIRPSPPSQPITAIPQQPKAQPRPKQAIFSPQYLEEQRAQGVRDTTIADFLAASDPEVGSQINFVKNKFQNNPEAITGYLNWRVYGDAGYQPPPPEEKGFFGRLADDAQERSANVGKSLERYQSGQQGLGSTALQFAGEAFGLGTSDTVGEAVKSGINYTPEFVKEPIRGIAQQAGQTEFGKGVMATAQRTAEGYGQFKQDHPVLTENLEAAGNIASSLPVGALAGEGGKILVKGAVKGAVQSAEAGAKGMRAAGDIAGGMTKYAASQATGLAPETMKFIVNHTDEFSGAQQGVISRATVAEKVRKATQGVLDDLSDTGKAYEGVRKTGGTVTIPGGSIGEILKKKGIKFDSVDDGLKIKLSTDIDTSIPITKGELAELEEFVNLISGKGSLTPAQFLNVRNKLTQMSKFDASKSDAFRSFAKEMRSEWNKLGRGQVKGLEKLDAQYGPLVEEASKLRKDFIDIGPDGQAVLKDTALAMVDQSGSTWSSNPGPPGVTSR